MAIELHVGQIPIVHLTVRDNDPIPLHVGAEYIHSGDIPEYEGNYDVTPSSSTQILSTNGLKMRQDVTVFEIPYASVSNPQGGMTVTIGGN